MKHNGIIHKLQLFQKVSKILAISAIVHHSKGVIHYPHITYRCHCFLSLLLNFLKCLIMRNLYLSNCFLVICFPGA